MATWLAEVNCVVVSIIPPKVADWPGPWQKANGNKVPYSAGIANIPPMIRITPKRFGFMTSAQICLRSAKQHL